ncbi:hypothetical protein [Brucella haematophila]|uniref:hypothetical protein n=1 Tax=Brucella haematophila TaxID=419474 RepID=UPI00110E1B19|nr:hypothetical protein [Brucella haematophila]TMV01943.1 hypothetical protein FGI60_12965 [Brucella haematophila]
MKNPIRNVVVEYKNRRARKSGNALWGNLDLKSIAREVEEDTKAPTSADQGTAPISQTDNEPAAPIHASTPQVEAKTAPKILIANIPEPVATKASMASPEPEAPATAEATVSPTPAKKKVNPSSRLKPIADKPVKAKPAPKIVADILDELAALEAENTALKRQLAQKLNTENQKMRKMLVRIETQIKL